MEEIKKFVKEKKVFIGADQTIKGLKIGKVSKVFLASNCQKEARGDIKRYAKLSNAEVVELDVPNDELGVICKKQFSISIIGVKKEG